MSTEAKGLFGTLFDFEFKSFITIKFIKVIYVILMAIILLSALIYFILALVAGASQDGGIIVILLALIFIPLLTLVYLLILRIFMETIVVFFRIGENTSALVAAAGLPPVTGDMNSLPGPQPPAPTDSTGYDQEGGVPPPAPDSGQSQTYGEQGQR
ncbi:hypothetical protein BH23ACT6_BH23ACT6_26420 [soil metagenome]